MTREISCGETCQPAGQQKRILGRTAGRLFAARSGAIAVQFALLLIPLIGAAGGAVDLAIAYQLKTVLDNAADASAVAAVAVDSPAAIASRSMSSDGPISAGTLDATRVFNVNVGSISSYANVAFKPKVIKTGMTISSSTSYTAVLQTSFLNILGIPNWTIVGSSQATSNLVPYMDFYLLLDNTPSMQGCSTLSTEREIVAFRVM